MPMRGANVLGNDNPGRKIYVAAVLAAGAALLGAAAAAVSLLARGDLDLWSYVILVPILGLAWLAHHAYKESVAENLRRLDDLMQIHLSTIEALTLAIDAKDPHAQGHVRRVQAYALELASRLMIPPREHEALRAAALLHDIGKLAIPDHVLNKPGKLSEMEYQKVKVHPAVAAEILANVEFPYPVVPIVRHHHERWDGSGYPDGLRGEEIPFGARILAVADVFEALTSDRVYRHRKTHEEARDIIAAASGVHFDPQVVRLLRDDLAAVVAAAERTVAAGPEPHRTRWAHCDAALGLPGIGAAAVWGGPSTAPEAASRRPGPPGAESGGFGDPLHRGIAPVVAGAAGEAVTAAVEAAPPSRVLSDISSAQREVYALYEIAQTLGSSLRLADVLDLVVSKIGQLVPYHTCVVYLLEDTRETLSARFASGANIEALRGRAVRLGEGITGWAALQGSSRFSTSPELDLAGTGASPADYSTVAAFPLCHDGEVLGVITLYFPKGVPCLDDHIRMMEIIARLSAGAVFNSRIFAETQESAFTDDLTNLPNSRYLHQVFNQETIRSQQAGQPMAFLEMDLDDFKTVNDRFGHQAGDRYLAEVSRVLRSHLRERDILVRLSGDEFAAILPLTGFGPAALLAERLQQAVDLFSLKLEEGRVARSGISIGIALYPQDGESFEDLLVRADYNMYENKSARKRARLERIPNVLPFPIRNPGQSG
ncbi:MAG TPA: HD domain-containing phosphohydrolase [Candidatus Polarisedimenticolia bacterium]|nr:HD domain-containing phosphohydrolase [Candidatus Polarisedimenticolia bacterium]